ncbi:anthranilate synthase component I family protein [Agriterribacter sp.]|uniref:anthranilate synthase component I family protein n=1 Tax=Agriterribacter sp. TaxID=2821509 RepID=UPI002BB3BC47|nr:anthranilate synthase component I family protein [Agriterribacter sp.]HRO48402.1 anthranilate synthase component I family protein [Agriterribacter sp.]HRQ19065.1 anthranilate synthase component I family protein [Agriterribacter sp.]
MKKIEIKTRFKKMLSDVYTPVGIYLRVRDRFRDTILLESTDYHAAENSFSFICINAIAGMEITSHRSIEFKLPGQQPEQIPVNNPAEVPGMLWDFMQRFDVEPSADKIVASVQGLYGYTTFDAVQFFDTITFTNRTADATGGHPAFASIPLMRYRLYQYVIAINHFKNEMYLCENGIPGISSDVEMVESLIRSKDVPVFPFRANGTETSNMTDEDYRQMVQKGIQSCYRGDVFQIVLSRRFARGFTGDEFNVYRALRNINPSPYLFYFDYGDYRLMGSSPESQLIIKNGKAVVHPIAGTFKRSGDDETDQQMADKLLHDPKENAEHVMLVDLARNDLSRLCDEVKVKHYRQVQYYSHVIHLVSEVTGNVKAGTNPFHLLATTFPAGTLSGAPKFKAMQLIDAYEPTSRSYYGGAIGFVGFNGSCNHAIMIRTFLSKNNTLISQAGAGIVAASNPESELQEVNNKLNALKKAVEMAEGI